MGSHRTPIQPCAPLNLYCRVERATLKTVNRLRKYVACLLVLTLPLTAWAGVGAPCEQISDSVVPAQTLARDAHAHHREAAGTGGGEQSRISMDRSAHHGAESSNPSSKNGCPCCDGCETPCALSSCSPVAMAIALNAPVFTGGESHARQVDELRAGPFPHVLYRPPIFSV